MHESSLATPDNLRNVLPCTTARCRVTLVASKCRTRGCCELVMRMMLQLR